MPSLDRGSTNDLLGSSASNTGVTVAGAGQSFSVTFNANRSEPPIYAWEIFFPGVAPATFSLNLEGSLDGVHFYPLDTYSTTTAALRYVTDKPALYVRADLTAITTPGGGVIVRLSAF
jgi:hypothetical protein